MDENTKLALQDRITGVSGTYRRIVLAVDEIKNMYQINDVAVENELDKMETLLVALDSNIKLLYSAIMASEVEDNNEIK